MPIRRRANKRRGGRRPRRVARKDPISRMPAIAGSGRGQMASIVETITGTASLVSGSAYAQIFNLALFPRAKSLASQFQFYKAARVTYTYEPLYNTFQEGGGGGGGGPSKPYMYVQMNRTQLLYAGADKAELQASGARPMPFTTMKTISYTPNWCSSGVISTNGSNPVISVAQAGLQKEYTWLTCPTQDSLGSANTTIDVIDNAINQTGTFSSTSFVVANKPVYNGHIVFFDQASGSNDIARVTVTVHWLFKGAHFSPQQGTVNPSPP